MGSNDESDAPLKRRPGNPNMIKGAPSVNPTGRPPGSAGIAKYISEQTNGGRELVDRLLELSRKTDGNVREVQTSTVHLLDRLIGRSQESQTLQLTLETPAAGGLPSDFYLWTVEKRRAYIDAHAVRQVSS